METDVGCTAGGWHPSLLPHASSTANPMSGACGGRWRAGKEGGQAGWLAGNGAGPKGQQRCQFSTLAARRSFGVVLYELATGGQTPYGPMALPEMMQYIRSGKVGPRQGELGSETHVLAVRTQTWWV